MLRATGMAALVARAEQLAVKLYGQDSGEVHWFLKFSDSGAKARFSAGPSPAP